MLRILMVITLLSCIVGIANSQLYDDFADGDFSSNPTWSGDIQDFIINSQYKLNLDAPEAGESILYTKYKTEDSMSWEFFLDLDFNPSNSNKIRVYFMIDTPKIDSASGYYIEIGENGNDDNLNFFQIQKGISTKLAEGAIGLFATPFKVNINITKQQSGFWSFNLKNNSQYYTTDFELINNTFDFDTAYFLLNMLYTKTRTNKFIFDDINISKYLEDDIPPKLIESKLINKYKLELVFDEQLEANSIYEIENYSIAGIKTVPMIIYKIDQPNKVVLEFKNEFQSGTLYQISVSGLKDLKNNKIINQQKSKFFLIERPNKEDIVLNEILFNPNKNGVDFIEITNISNKFLNIKGIKLKNHYKKDNNIQIEDNYILFPKEYLCVTNDTNNIINNYFIPDTSNLIQNKIPSLDDKFGSIALYNYDSILNQFITIDSFDYSESLHSIFLDKYEGISLERKDPFLNTNDKFNWTSCSTNKGGATPGYKNSTYLNTKFDNSYEIVIQNKVFSPNNDGIDDQLIIKYNFKETDLLANFYIYDSRGRLITHLLNNEILSKQGVINWNGHINSNKAPIGVYILYYKIIDTNSNTKIGKKAFVIADYLK